MKLSTQAINLFEQLATNAHHKVDISKLMANQTLELQEIYSSKSSEYFRKQFSDSSYFADSIKVTEI